MQQGHDPILRLLGKVMHDRDDDITLEPLPKRWVDLILFLDEQEKKHGQAEVQVQPRKRPEH